MARPGGTKILPLDKFSQAGLPRVRAAERGQQEGHFAPEPRGLRGLIVGEF